MDAVWKAERHESPEKERKKVVLKLIILEATAVQKEVEVLSKLRHPNVIRLQAIVKETLKRWYLEFPRHECDFKMWIEGEERIEGKRDIARQKGRNSAAIHILAQVLEGLNYIHQLEYIHRDIKPANVFLTPSGKGKDKFHAVIADFQSCKVLAKGKSYYTTKLPRDGITEKYADPDVRNWQNATSYYDMFSFGVMMYEAITREYSVKQNFPGNICKILKERAPGWPRMLKIEDEEASILRKLLIGKKTRASELLQSDYFSGIEKKDKCIIYHTEVPVSEGIYCSEDSTRHFTSLEAFHHLVEVEMKNRVQFSKYGGQIRCPGYECENYFSTIAVLQIIGTNTMLMKTYLDNLQRITKDKADSEAQSKFKDFKERWLKRCEEEGKFQFQVSRHEELIKDCILNPRCPGCSRPIQRSFSGCFAVTCYGCKAEFCYWCFRVCKHDAHKHVLNCKKSLDPKQVFSSEENKTKSLCRKVEEDLNEYLRTIPSNRMKKSLLSKCKLHIIQAYPELEKSFY
mmetsp:Transcript_13135/g.21066  ORF Transcript_13135/g.21066 Transcript_13135/m.21066 type:complete len:515 (-) Transcript_13135:300-1844(-)